MAKRQTRKTPGRASEAKVAMRYRLSPAKIARAQAIRGTSNGAELRRLEGIRAGTVDDRRPSGWDSVSRSFVNDALLAMSCREARIVLVTKNARDFTRIAAVRSFDFVTSWPVPRL